MDKREFNQFVARAMSFELERASFAFDVLGSMIEAYSKLKHMNPELFPLFSNVTMTKYRIQDTMWQAQKVLLNNLKSAKKKHHRRGSNKNSSPPHSR